MEKPDVSNPLQKSLVTARLSDYLKPTTCAIIANAPRQFLLFFYQKFFLHILCKFQISAAHMSGDVSNALIDDVYLKLSLAEPGIKLLYVTPEKLSSSTKLRDTLSTLHKRNKIARYIFLIFKFY